MANPIHRINIVAKDKRSQRKVADSTTELDKTDPLGADPDLREPLCEIDRPEPFSVENAV